MTTAILGQKRLFGPYGKAFALLAAMIALHFCIANVVSLRSTAELMSAKRGASILQLAILPPVFFALWLYFVCMFRRIARPTKTIGRMLYRNRFWLTRSVLLFTLLYPAHQSFLTLKVAIPRLVPFYADDFFIELDRMMFFGNDPWTVTHALFGNWTGLIDTFYYQWFMIVTFVTLWATFSRDPKFQIKASIMQFLVWALLGNLLAVLLSSVGPIFYDEFYGSTYFAPLLDRLDPSLTTMSVRGFLLSQYGIEAIGSGISAAPSIHVGMAMMIFMMVRERFGRAWPTYIASFYVALIFTGSIHLAWHYAIDGVISIVLVPMLWFAVSRFLDRLDNRYRPAGAIPVAAPVFTRTYG